VELAPLLGFNVEDGGVPKYVMLMRGPDQQVNIGVSMLNNGGNVVQNRQENRNVNSSMQSNNGQHQVAVIPAPPNRQLEMVPLDAYDADEDRILNDIHGQNEANRRRGRFW
jgi:hypothetical protein